MIKNLFIAFLLVAFGITAAMASVRDVPGKVTAIEGEQVTIIAGADLPNWAGKGRFLRVNDDAGTNILRGAEITEAEGRTITITTKNAGKLKVEQAVVLNRGRQEAGC